MSEPAAPAAVTYALARSRFLSAEPPIFVRWMDALSYCQGRESPQARSSGRGPAHSLRRAARTKRRRSDQRCHPRGYCSHPYGGRNNSVSGAGTQLAEGLPRCPGRSGPAAKQVRLNLIINAIERDARRRRRGARIAHRSHNEPDGVFSRGARFRFQASATADIDGVSSRLSTRRNRGVWGSGWFRSGRSIIEAHDGELLG